MELFRHRRPANEVPALQHPHFQSGNGEVGGADQTVVAAAQHQHIIPVTPHGRTSVTMAGPGVKSILRRSST